MLMQTERLTLRLLSETDAPVLLQLALDFEASPYAAYDAPFPTDPEGCRQLARSFAESELFFAVCLRDTQQMIGFVCFHQEGDIYDLGYRFLTAFHGNGYALESCTAAMAHLQKTRPVTEFTAGTALANASSCRLLQRLGFVLQTTESVSFRKDAAGNDITFEGGNFLKTVS